MSAWMVGEAEGEGEWQITSMRTEVAACDVRCRRICAYVKSTAHTDVIDVSLCTMYTTMQTQCAALTGRQTASDVPLTRNVLVELIFLLGSVLFIVVTCLVIPCIGPDGLKYFVVAGFDGLFARA